MNIVLVIFLILIFSYLIYKFPAGMFMFGITVHFNIGEYFEKNYMGFPNYFSFQDFGLVLAFIAGSSIAKISKITFPKELNRLLIILVVFVFYQILFSIIINLNLTENPGRIIHEIAIHKWRIFSIFICVPAYYVYNYNSKTVYNYIVVISFLILVSFFVTLFTPLKLVETKTLMRGYVFGAERIWFENWGYIQFTIIMSLIVLFLKIKDGKKFFLYSSSIMVLLATLITMTRGTIIHTIGSILLSIFIIAKYYNIKVSRTFFYTVIITFLSISALIIIFPNYLILIFEVFNLTYLELTGQIRRGMTQSRTEFELVTLMPLYLDSFFFGTGFLREYFDAYGTQHELGLADFAILGNLALYGTFGFIIFLLRYFYIHKVIIKTLKIVKDIRVTHDNKYEIVLGLLAIISFYTWILFRFHNFSMELVYDAVNFGLWIGFIYGFYNKYKLRIQIINE